MAEYGLPEGTFSLLFGVGNEVGPALVGHPATRAVGFTGSPGRWPCALPAGDGKAGADSGLCRDEQRQPGAPAATCAGGSCRRYRAGIRRFARDGRRPVLHQPGSGDRAGRGRLRPIRGRSRAGRARQAGGHDADPRHRPRLRRRGVAPAGV
ncbi:aldehyde dehydrogenase family protein (plasmid) [Cupriavidus basilensis]